MQAQKLAWHILLILDYATVKMDQNAPDVEKTETSDDMQMPMEDVAEEPEIEIELIVDDVLEVAETAEDIIVDDATAEEDAFIAEEAAKQSKRSRIPKINNIIDFDEIKDLVK